MVHTKIYGNITLGQILMIMMVANIMVSLFVLTVMLFGRDNPTKINQQINATSEKNRQYNAITLQALSDQEKRLESFITNSSHDNHLIIAKIDNSTTQINGVLQNINSLFAHTGNATAQKQGVNAAIEGLKTVNEIKALLLNKTTR
jgi:hypothetical protein